MFCASCGTPNATVGQPCPRCGRVVALPGDAGEPTSSFTPGPGAQPTVAFSQAPFSPPAPAAGPPPRARRAGLIALVGVLAVVLIGGGVAFAGFQFGWFGGSGKQPYTALPVTSIGYYQMDLNPSTDQKLAAFNFFRELPQMQNAAQNASFDVKEQLWNEWAKNNDTNGLTYAADIKPWLGDRMGLALVPGASAGQPVGVVAVQVTDEKLAAQKLPAVLKSNLEVVNISNGYAVLTQVGEKALVTTALAAGTLDKNSTFTADMASLGSTGWVAGWVDLKAMVDATTSSGSTSPQVSGRATFALRFSGNSLEYAGGFLGMDPQLIPAAHGGTDLGDLPADTGFAASIQGGGAWLKANWDQLSKSIPEGYAPEGWTLPEDPAAVLGNQVTFAVPRSTIAGYAEGTITASTEATVPAMGAKFNTDRTARVRELLDATAPEGLVSSRVDGSTVSVASTSGYLSQLTETTGAKLSSTAGFTAAVPESAKASVALYFDMASLGTKWTSNLGSESSAYAPFLKALTSVGFSLAPNATGASWSLRVARS
jgi:hypothetical protein